MRLNEALQQGLCVLHARIDKEKQRRMEAIRKDDETRVEEITKRIKEFKAKETQMRAMLKTSSNDSIESGNTLSSASPPAVSSRRLALRQSRPSTANHRWEPPPTAPRRGREYTPRGHGID